QADDGVVQLQSDFTAMTGHDRERSHFASVFRPRARIQIEFRAVSFYNLKRCYQTVERWLTYRLQAAAQKPRRLANAVGTFQKL
ncbi:MAG TPA: hypothetical protein VGG59_08485, partial [Acidobacteriaceae bacterium]